MESNQKIIFIRKLEQVQEHLYLIQCIEEPALFLFSPVCRRKLDNTLNFRNRLAPFLVEDQLLNNYQSSTLYVDHNSYLLLKAKFIKFQVMFVRKK